MHAHPCPRGLKYEQKNFAESDLVFKLHLLHKFVAAVAKAPVCQSSLFYSAVGSNPGGGPKNALIFFLIRLLHIFPLRLRL